MVKLGSLSGKDLDLSSWCISLDEKLFVYGSINLVEDMSRVFQTSLYTMKKSHQVIIVSKITNN